MRFGIIGTNFVSDFFMAGAKQQEKCEVIAVCGTSMEKANAFADKYAISKRFANYKKMAELKELDAVYIAVPNGLHKEMSIYFLERKIPVFCEKPLAGNIDEVKEMIACSKNNKTYLQEGLIPLYNPNLKIVKDNLDKLGKLHQVTFNFSKYSSRYDAYLNGENPTTFRADLCNGAIMDLGVYVFADIIYLFGKPKKVLSAAELLDTGSDVSGSSILIYDDLIVNLHYSKASDTKNLSEICGELGSITIDYPSQPQKVTLINRKAKTEEIISSKPKENFYYEITEMIERIEQGYIESQYVPHELSISIHTVLTECRKNAGIVFPCDK